jgi:LAS superfamily LD-carboxypeptidase LdcB
MLVLTSFTFQNKNISKDILLGKSKAIQPLLKGSKYKLQVKAYDALEKMLADALKKGVRIEVVSAYRSFDHQNKLWKRKYLKYRKLGYSVKKAVNKIVEYTAIPGTSRHHWGTEVDLRDYKRRHTPSLRSNKNSTYEKWMHENAHKYGFYLVYTNNKFRTGYKYESWHYSYRELSNPLLKEYQKLNLYSVLRKENILGKSVFTKHFTNDYLDEHILGINGYLH